MKFIVVLALLFAACSAWSYITIQSYTSLFAAGCSNTPDSTIPYNLGQCYLDSTNNYFYYGNCSLNNYMYYSCGLNASCTGCTSYPYANLQCVSLLGIISQKGICGAAGSLVPMFGMLLAIICFWLN